MIKYKFKTTLPSIKKKTVNRKKENKIVSINIRIIWAREASN